MPTVFRCGEFRFYFFSNEGDPREPIHIHVRGAGGEAKYWVEPDIVLARSNGFDARTLRRLAALVNDHSEIIQESWHEHFGN